MARPTDYKPEYCDMLIVHMSAGYSFDSFAATIDCCGATLDNWAKANPAFLAAKKVGRLKQLYFYEGLGINASSGQVKDFNATAFVWMTKNMLKWREQRDAPPEENTEALDLELRDILAKDESER